MPYLTVADENSVCACASKAHGPEQSYDEFSYIYKETNAGFHPLRTLF